MRCGVSLKFALVTLLLASPLAASAAASKCDRLIATGGADNPPFLWRDPQNPKRLVGANADLLKRIADSLDLKLDLLYTGDAEQALEEVTSGRMDVLADASPTLQKLTQLDFIHPSITKLETSAWVRSDPGFLYASRDDLSGRTGNYIVEAELGDELRAYAKDHLVLDTAPNLDQAMQRLLGGNIDYVLHERYSAVAQLGPLGLLDVVQRLERPVSSRGMHLAVAHDSACNGPWLRGQLAVKMTELQEANVPEQLLAENIERWRQQQSVVERDTQR